jgi:hypothetical protein
VAEDADLAFTVPNVVDGVCYNAGQSCCAVERAYVHRSCYDVFIERVEAVMSEYRLGDPLDENTTVGPLASSATLDLLDHQVADAVARGARLILGQFSFIATLVTLVVSARLKKFDRTLEEAALNLGANRFEVIWFITLRFLRPALIGAGAVAFLMSFENFNTTLFLVGSETTLPINLYLQVRDGSTPVINAISFLLIVGTSLLAMVNLYFGKKEA